MADRQTGAIGRWEPMMCIVGGSSMLVAGYPVSQFAAGFGLAIGAIGAGLVMIGGHHIYRRRHSDV